MGEGAGAAGRGRRGRAAAAPGAAELERRGRAALAAPGAPRAAPPGGCAGRGGASGGAGRAWRGARPGLRGRSRRPTALPGHRGRRRESRGGSDGGREQCDRHAAEGAVGSGPLPRAPAGTAPQIPLTRAVGMARSADSVPPQASDDHTPPLATLSSSTKDNAKLVPAYLWSPLGPPIQPRFLEGF